MTRPPRTVLRLHRATLWGALAFLALMTAGTAALRRGLPEDGDVPGTLYSTYLDYAPVALLALPALVGAFVAGPLVGRELEGGQHRLAWAQSRTPAQWLTARLVTGAGLAAAAALALMGVFRLGAPRGYTELMWPDRGTYEAIGPALVAYCLLAVAVGALTALVLRRTLLAVAVTGALTTAVLYVLGSLRWDLVPLDTATGRGDGWGHRPGLPFDAFWVNQGVTNAAGERFIERHCVPERLPGHGCPADTRVTQWFVDFHPRSHFWYTQLIECGIVLALAAAAGCAAYAVLRRRTP
ncbi:ABC transporter permease [Streptomyces longispororuber]|uniref:ABC transporter permease n=1 Tax=Streptomyces longispororuber TaxID=68230 RepID=UPI00167CA8DA|nr:ABC transporter permease [Streptomyces longispororuber]